MTEKNRGQARPGLGGKLYWLLAGLLTMAVVWWLSAGYRSVEHQPAEPGAQAEARPSTHWVDENQCQQCHQAQFQDWQGSHHQLAMLLPTDDSVRGDFSGALLHSDQETTEFFRRGEEFWVRTPGARGEPSEFRVAYTFGWEPLQQYLIALDGGRLQALGAAWDTEQEQWFHLYDGLGVDVAHPLHWTQAAHNANTQCIDCHTTGFEPRYDTASHHFDSQWQSLGVGCQACHGPASAHVNWARSFAEGSLANDPLKGFSQALQQNSQQVETCARCHSRRTPLGQPVWGERFEDAFRLSPLSAELYEVDGKIFDEVFEHGSFVQSAMHRAGVVCSDCHNPHSGQLRAAGNAVCSQCHNAAAQPRRADIVAGGLKALDYNSPAHHHHAPGSAGAVCRNCHMPGKLYMGNDLRHDHSFSSPDPVQALALNHSDACLSCHTDEATDKLVASFQQWFPHHQPRDGGYAQALDQARKGQPGAAQALFTQLARDDLPGLRRAALLAELPRYPSPTAATYLLDAFDHEDAGVRRAATEAAMAVLDPRRFQLQLNALLNDPIRSVRLAASEQLLLFAEQYELPLEASPLREYETVQQQLLANAEAHFNLAKLYQLTGRSEQVEASLRAAMERNPAFSPASIALAQWLDGNTPGAGLHLLETQLAQYPNDPDLHHALGLAKIRARHYEDGVRALEQAHAMAPDNDHYAYVLAVAWHDTGQRQRALQLLRDQLQQHPANRSLRFALLGYLSPGEESNALIEALRLQNPEDPALSNLSQLSLTGN